MVHLDNGVAAKNVLFAAFHPTPWVRTAPVAMAILCPCMLAFDTS